MTGPLVDLAGRHAVVTGAASGLGQAVAHTLAGVGARVSVLDVNAAGAAQTVTQIRDAGGHADAISCDVADAGSIAAAFEQVAGSGPADILVNNAGINPRGASLEVTDEVWAHTMAINLAGYYLCARRFAEQLIAAADPQRPVNGPVVTGTAGNGPVANGSVANGTVAKGTVVNVSSIGGSTSLGRGNFVYGVSKGGVEQLTRELAVAWAPRGIRVNAVAPCQIATDGLRTLSVNPSAEGRLIDTFLRGIPLGRLVEPAEVAAAVAFLASDAAAMITGVILPVDGGNLALNAGGTIGE
jgi:NAD(P)-dependent dehydrogenase (short-subunit alcohol dehydrogenase family)